MKRFLLASMIATPVAALVGSVYSPLFIDFWSRHPDVRMVVGHGGDPTDYLIALLLGLFGIDTSSSTYPIVVGAFVQWFLGVYFIGGAIFRARPAPGSPGGLRS